MATNYTKTYFAKPIENINAEDLDAYFQIEREETDTLEYKSIPANQNKEQLINVVITTIAGFLNSEGGLLIFGAPKGTKPDGRKEQIFVGPPTYSSVHLEKDWLINKITGLISPMPKGIAVKIITNINGDHAYLIEVQQSEYKPHQLDGRYYIRLDGQNKAAPHYLVDAMMKQIRYPDVRAVIKFGSRAQILQDYLLVDITIGVFNFSAFQNEEDISLRVLLVGSQFVETDVNSRIQYNHDAHEMVIHDFVKVLHMGMPQSTHRKILIRPDEKEVIILLTFGGKKAPAKYSCYNIDLSKSNGMDVNKMLVDVRENLLFVDKTKLTPDELIEDFKKR